MVTEHFANRNLSVVLVFIVCGVRQNLYVFSLYRNPDLDDRIFYCLQASMAAVQAEDVRASFLFVGNLNIHHQEWLGSTNTKRHGVAVAAIDFATVFGCDQLVVGTTHARGGTLDHRVVSVIESSLREIIGSKKFALINLSSNFCETTINDNKVFLENLVAVH